MNTLMISNLNRSFSEQESLTQRLYARRCSNPCLADILNGLHELGLPFEYHALAQQIHRTWHFSDGALGEKIRHWFDSDTELGALIRAWFKRDFLEVSQIEAEEEMARRVPLSEQVNDADSEPEDMGAAT